METNELIISRHNRHYLQCRSIAHNLSLGAINIPKHNKISVIESNLTPPQRMGDKEG